MAAPYTDLINEYTLQEMFEFHIKFKQIKEDIDFKQFESIIELPGQSQKSLQHFSSGMKQKIQIALALLSETPIVLLDEPTSFLDAKAKSWFEKLLVEYKNDRLILLASNDHFDLDQCDLMVDLNK
jgi:ABC-type multidrug transport system ATPase subunit